MSRFAMAGAPPGGLDGGVTSSVPADATITVDSSISNGAGGQPWRKGDCCLSTSY